MTWRKTLAKSSVSMRDRGRQPSDSMSMCRASSIDLTMNCYVDPPLLGVQGAVESLSEFSVTDPNENRQRIAAGAETLQPSAVTPAADFSCVSPSMPVTYAAISPETSGRLETQRTPGKTTFPRSSVKGGQADLNRRPDRKSTRLNSSHRT